jgi:hypothetical protein
MLPLNSGNIYKEQKTIKDMKLEKRELSQNITQIGAGGVGAKALDLVVKEDDILSARFSLAKTYVFGFEALEAVLRENKLTFPQALNGIGANALRMPTEVRAYLTGIVRELKNVPIVVRSSAPGDSNGNGVYESVVVPPSEERLSEAFAKVVSSYFSSHAINYRAGRSLEFTDDVGVIVQPVLGLDRRNYFAPTLSGFAFTTAKKNEPLVSVVFGLGGGVQARNGVRIDCDIANKYEGNLYKILAEFASHMNEDFTHGRKKPELDADTVTGMAFKYGKNGLMDGKMQLSTLYLKKDALEAIKHVNMRDLRDRLKDLEVRTNAPQYVEWTGVVKDGRLDISIVQIADAMNVDEGFSEKMGRPLYTGHMVSNHGKKECEEIVYCANREALPELMKYNAKAMRDSFVLLFPASLASNAHFGVNKKLELSHYKNAGVLLEVPDIPHEREPIAHFAGEITSLNKLFAVCSVGPEELPTKLLRANKSPEYQKLIVGKIPSTVTSSIVEDTLRVYARRS